MRDAVAGDARFVVSRSPRAAAASTATSSARCRWCPPTRDHVAMADQDDGWHPDKLAHAARRDSATPSSSTATRGSSRATASSLSDTYWTDAGATTTRDLLSLLLANAVTGRGLAVPRASCSTYALPFPPAQFAHFHDHWIALRALARATSPSSTSRSTTTSSTATAALGHEGANRIVALRERLGSLRRDPRERVRLLADDLLRRRLPPDAVRRRSCELRCGDRMSRAERRDARALPARADRSLPGARRLAARGARELGRAARDARRGVDARLRAHLAAAAGARPTRDRPRARPAPRRGPAARRSTPSPARAAPGDPAPRGVADKIAPLRSPSRDDAPERINLLIPTIDLEHFFGGYIAQAQPRPAAGRARPAGAARHRRPGRPAARRLAAAGRGLRGPRRAVRPRRGRLRARVAGASRSAATDRFIATTWWTAHIARDALRALGRRALPLPDPGVRAVHVPDGHLRRAGRRVLRLPPLRAVLDRAAARLLPPPRDRRLRGGRARATRARRRSRTRSPRSPPPTAAELAGRAHAPAALLRPARAARRAQHVRARSARAQPRARARAPSRAAGSCTGSARSIAGRRLELGGGASLDLLPRSEQGDYAGSCASTTSAWR